MHWIFIIFITLGIIYYIFFTGGNDKFWHLVNKYPVQAYDFFINNDCWYVVHPGEHVDKPSNGNWAGPFFIYVPNIGKLKIYGRIGEFEQKQEEFKKQIKEF